MEIIKVNYKKRFHCCWRQQNGGYMASFKKFLTYTALTAAAVAGGIVIYKKLTDKSEEFEDDFDDFDDDDFDDDFDDLDMDTRSYTSLTSEDTTVVDKADEEVDEEVDAE